MRRRSTAILMPVLLGAWAAVAGAQSLETSALPIEIQAPSFHEQEQVRLTLREAYRIALERNLDLQVGRYDLAAAEASIFEATGTFDPNLRANTGGDWTRSPAATQLAGARITEARNTRFGLGLDWFLPSGTKLDVSVDATRSETNSQFFYVNPRWQTGLTFSLQQSLLRGFGTLVNRAPIVIARNRRDQTSAQFAATVIATLRQVEEAYWDLAAARWAVRVREHSLELAQRLLEETRERVKVGTSAPIDLVQSEATVAARRQEVIAARNAADNAEDALKAILGFDRPEEWDVSLDTVEDLEPRTLSPDLEKAIQTALERRPEIHQELLALATLKLNVQVARNDTLPRLDLQANYGWGGLGGTITIVDPDTGQIIEKIPGGVDDAFRQIRDRDFPNWAVGLNFTMPLGNNQAKARLVQQRFALQKEETRLRALQQQIIREVRVAVRALEDGMANMEAAHAARIAAERNVEAEETKFKNGLTTNYQVTKIQDDLAKAQLTEIQANVFYRKAVVGYLAATGTLLDREQVAIVDPGQPDVPHDFWRDVKWLQMSGPRHGNQVPEDDVPEHVAGASTSAGPEEDS